MSKLLSVLLMAWISFCLLALVSLPVYAGGDNTDKAPQTPFVHNVTPDTAKADKSVTMTGIYLGKSHVIDFYLTRGDQDYKLTIKVQKPDQIVATIPSNITPGKYRIMVQTAGELPRFIEQPVYLKIE